MPRHYQRKNSESLLCDLMHNAFVELRYLSGEQAHDLAYAFHNLPKEIYGWGSWRPDSFRAGLASLPDDA